MVGIFGTISSLSGSETWSSTPVLQTYDVPEQTPPLNVYNETENNTIQSLKSVINRLLVEKNELSLALQQEGQRRATTKSPRVIKNVVHFVGKVFGVAFKNLANSLAAAVILISLNPSRDFFNEPVGLLHV